MLDSASDRVMDAMAAAWLPNWSAEDGDGSGNTLDTVLRAHINYSADMLRDSRDGTNPSDNDDTGLRVPPDDSDASEHRLRLMERGL